MPFERLGDLAVDVADGLEHAFAEIALLIAVPEFDRFQLAGGRAGGHGRPSLAAVREIDIRFHCGIPA